MLINKLIASARCHPSNKADNRGVAEGEDGYFNATTDLSVWIHTKKGKLMLRVYAASDLHGKQARIERLRSKLSILKPDLLVLAGDITNFSRVSDTLRAINSLALPVLMIRGNSDLKHVENLCRSYTHCHCLHGVRLTFHAIPFVGLGGTWPIPFHSRIALNENAQLRMIKSHINHRTVLVTHTPPRGAQDLVMGRFHAGSRGLRRLIET